MISQQEMTEYLAEKIPVLKLVVQTQWDFLTFSDVQKWLDKNFGNDIEGRFYAVKILLHLIYYKRKDMVALIEFGLYDKIFGVDYKSQLIQKDEIFRCKTDFMSDLDKLKARSLFAPILDSAKPYESGNTIVSDLVHSVGVNQENVDFHWLISPEKLVGMEYLIFMDDCLGSGNQIKKFFGSLQVQQLISQAQTKNVKVFCLILVGYQVNIEKLKSELLSHNIELVVCEILTDRHRIFSKDNVIWDKNENELEEALRYFKHLSKTKGTGYLGFKKLDFAVILNNRTPNWTLPLIWKKSVEWEMLIQRKTSL